MENLVTMCQGFEDYKPCDDCRRKDMKVEFMKSYYYPPIDLSIGRCNLHWPSTDWQEPQRDKAISQNGNNGESYE